MVGDDYRVSGRLRRVVTVRHYGPGTHPGTGTDQTVHARNVAVSEQPVAAQARPRRGSSRVQGTEAKYARSQMTFEGLYQRRDELADAVASKLKPVIILPGTRFDGFILPDGRVGDMGGSFHGQVLREAAREIGIPTENARGWLSESDFQLQVLATGFVRVSMTGPLDAPPFIFIDGFVPLPAGARRTLADLLAANPDSEIGYDLDAEEWTRDRNGDDRAEFIRLTEIGGMVERRRPAGREACADSGLSPTC